MTDRENDRQTEDSGFKDEEEIYFDIKQEIKSVQLFFFYCGMPRLQTPTIIP